MATIETLRKEYLAIAKRSGLPVAEFNRLARKVLEFRRGKFLKSAGPTNRTMTLLAPTPADWVSAAKAVKLECFWCAGTGKFHGPGHVENGVFKGKIGKCYRCNGTGQQTDRDRRRNWGYDNFHRRIPGMA